MRSMIGLLVASLALAACGAAADAPATDGNTTSEATAAPTTTDSPATPETGATITIENFSFGTPPTVGVGDLLTVVNEDGAAHTWTSDDGIFDSGTLGSGDTFEHAFEEAGEYSFFCEIHPGMIGAITVTG